MSSRKPPPVSGGFSGASKPLKPTSASVKPEADTDDVESVLRSKQATIGLLGTAGLGLIAAVVLFTVSGVINAEHQDQLQQRGAPAAEAQTRIDAAATAEAGLLDETRALRAVSQAQQSGENIADMQNISLTHTGPVDWESVPEIDEEMKALQRDPDPRTRDERYQIAQDEREEALANIDRRLDTGFDADSRNDEGFNAASRWDEAVPGLNDRGVKESLAEYTWNFSSNPIPTKYGEVEGVWILSDPSGELVAWVRGVFNPQSSIFEDLALGVAEEQVL